MNYLFFDCTNEWILISSGRIEEDKIVSHYNYKGHHPKESSYKFIVEIDKALKKSGFKKPDILFCCTGPGSFTGIRICVSTARNFSQIWNIPVLGIDSIETYSSYYYNKSGRNSMVLLKSNKEKVFAGQYDQNGYSGSFDIKKSELGQAFPAARMTSDQFSNEDPDGNLLDMNDDIPDALFAITSILKRSEFLSIVAATEKLTRQIDAKNMSYGSYRNLLPNYFRKSYAEEKNNE